MEALRSDEPDYTGLFLLIYVLVLGLLFFLDWVMRKIFPVGTFAIGQGIKRNNILGTIRGAVVTTVLLTIPIGLFIGFLTA